MALRTMLSQNSVRDFYALYRFLEVDYEGIIDLKVFLREGLWQKAQWACPTRQS